MNLFVTGGAGFIGSNFIRYILGLGKKYTVVNYDKLTYAGNLVNLATITENSNYRFVKGDICDTTAVETAIAGCDAIVHFASESHVNRRGHTELSHLRCHHKFSRADVWRGGGAIRSSGYEWGLSYDRRR
jgi:dTDP-D-glucose 4,6-dehydratase